MIVRVWRRGRKRLRPPCEHADVAEDLGGTHIPNEFQMICKECGARAAMTMDEIYGQPQHLARQLLLDRFNAEAKDARRLMFTKFAAAVRALASA